MNYPVEMRGGIPTDADMRKINAVSAYPLTADQVYIFQIRLCNNDVDRDFERFTTEALHSLAKMYVGKPGYIKHQEVSRIYNAYVSADIERTTKAGDVYCEVIADAYVPRSEISKELIEDLMTDKVKQVSVECSIASSTCSICGEEDCSHSKGTVYGKKLCFKILDKPQDVYEWSIVIDPKPDNPRLSLDEAIQHCHEVAEELRKDNSCDSCATEHEQLALWLEELKRLRVECDGMRSNWQKSVEKIRVLQGERNAAVSDLRKLVPAWKWDGAAKWENQSGTAPKDGRVDFG